MHSALLRTILFALPLALRDGTTRYTTNGNGGPMFVYVEDDKIIRITPIDLEKGDAGRWHWRMRARFATSVAVARLTL